MHSFSHLVKETASCIKAIKHILTGGYINKLEILLLFKSRLAKMYELLNNDLENDTH